MTRAASKTLALQTRAIARGRDVLYHGTRYRELILASGLLALSNSGGVYFTRDVETAVHWATLPRDDEGEGAILVFDRPSLRARYRLECTVGDEDSEESEEVVWDRHVDIAPHLIGLVSTQPQLCRARRVLISEQGSCAHGKPPIATTTAAREQGPVPTAGLSERKRSLHNSSGPATGIASLWRTEGE